MSISPRTNLNYVAAKEEFEQRFAHLAKNPSRKMKLLLEDRSMNKVFKAVEQWYKDGVCAPKEEKAEVLQGIFG
jgi:hypothetical protein